LQENYGGDMENDYPTICPGKKGKKRKTYPLNWIYPLHALQRYSFKISARDGHCLFPDS